MDLPGLIPHTVIHLLRGVLYREQQPALWQELLNSQGAVRDYLSAIGLIVYLDEAEGYAFLRQPAPTDSDDSEDENEAHDGGDSAPALPRLVQRRPLSYPLSLLLVILRKRLAEQDAGGEETRAIVERDWIVEQMRLFLPGSSNEAKLVEHIERHIKKAEEYGFLRALKTEQRRYEIRRILKALVDPNWLGDLDDKLEQYREHAAADA